MTPWKTVIVFSRVRLARRRSGSISSAAQRSTRSGVRSSRATSLVVAQRRRLALAVLFDVAEVLGTGVGDGPARAHHARQRPSCRFGEGSTQPRLGGALREIARRWSTARRPRRTERLFDLPS